VPWTLDAWVTAPLLLALAWFTLGWLRLRSRSRNGRNHLRPAAWFYTGWLVMAAALVSPLHAAGERSFTLHMLEHELLMLVGAPLLVLSRPVGIALWALPERWRASAGGLHRFGWFGRPWRLLSDPVVATTLQIVALWAWHAPALFDLALASDGWHIAQHLSFVLSALLFWSAMLEARRLRARTGMAVACLFATAVVGGALGALMALSDSPWYEGYRAMGMAPFGLSPAEDQQLAGLLMWVPGGLVHVLAALLLLARWLREEPSPRRHAAAAGQPRRPASGGGHA
jgi:cytochrome c oxidase assembly factor CtaG